LTRRRWGMVCKSFNPRPACGAKAILVDTGTTIPGFNPRPACGAKGGMPIENARLVVRFQSAPRVRGERAAQTASGISVLCFNPRPACGAKGPRRVSQLVAIPGFNPRPACGAKVCD